MNITVLATDSLICLRDLVRKPEKVIVGHSLIYPRYNTHKTIYLYKNAILIISQDIMHKSLSNESRSMTAVSLKNVRKLTIFVPS